MFRENHKILYRGIKARLEVAYEQLSIHEKNRLWKIFIEKITVYRTPDGEFNMYIYPKLTM